MSKQRLSVPRGAGQLSLGDYSTARVRFDQIERIFKLWGYAPTVTPLVDFFSVYEEFLSVEEARFSYRLFDRDGELLMIRSDITLFLAKQIAMQLSTTSLPLRLSYSGEILRDSFDHDIVKSDIHQSGVELVGVPDIDGDVEVLLLLFESLDALGGSDTVVHLGSRSFLERLAKHFRVASDKLVSALHRRDRGAVEELFPRRELVDMLFFIGSVEECASKAATLSEAMGSDAKEALSYLFELATLIGKTDFHPRLRIDLSETAMRSYYSGIVFAAYDVDAESAVSVGGRYDNLLSHFGGSAVAAGFSIYPHRVGGARRLPEVPPKIHAAEGKNVLDRYRHAGALRQKGRTVTL